MSDAIRIPIVADDAQFKQVMQRVQTTAAATGGAIGKVGAVVQGTGTLFAEAGTKIGGMAGNVGQLVSAFVVGGPLYLGIAAVTAGVTYMAAEWVKAREEAQKAADAWEKESSAIFGRLQKQREQIDALRKYGALGDADLFQQVEKAAQNLRRAETRRSLEQPKTDKELAEAGPNRSFQARKKADQERQAVLLVDEKVAEKKLNYAIEELELAKKRHAIEQQIADGKKPGKAGPRMILGTAVEGAVPLTEQEKMAAELAAREEERREIARDWAYENSQREAQDHKERMAQLEEYYDQRQAYGEKIAATAQQETAGLASYVGGQVDNVVGLYGALAGARAEGNLEAVRAVEEQEKWLAQRIAAETLKYIGTRAVAEGTILVGRGIGEAALGNVGAPGAIAAGAGLIIAGGAMGAAGAFLGGYASGASGSASGASGESSGYVAGRLATGTTEGGNGQVVVHHHYYGSVFGDEDSAARAVYRFHKRGARLEGAA